MFVRGAEYRRKEFHDLYGGQRQGGISTPKDRPFIFIFTGESGRQHGYDDYWENGVFNYFGEGQVGPMRMKGGNRALREHMSNGKVIHRFSIVGKGFVRYEGEASYLGDHPEPSKDREGNARDAIVFELAVDPDTRGEKHVPDLRSRRGPTRTAMWKMNLNKLKEMASRRPDVQDDARTRLQKVRKRSEMV